MEKEQRTRLQKATQDARRLLEEEFRSQLLQTYDIDVEKVRWAEEPGAHLLAEQRLIREKLIAWIEHKEAQINDCKEALLLALREMAFTGLNRFVALKLMEARELVRPCVSGGLESAGFLEFTAVAQGLLADQERSYRLYLETIFEDVSRELRALFDPRDPASLLWPKRAALLELLDILNRPELAALWSEDETLGWVYQYFNGDAERKKMREESAAPRNSRELAVRNQFFTPRYVVEFLTDNTLGRIWYEMRQGETRLKDCCRYLVRRSNEIWLQTGEEVPVLPGTEESLSQEELLRQPVHIPYRPLKDPREIRMLDPACGSMHFGLYAFDLYLEIYEEAWEIAQGSDEQVKQTEAFASFADYVAAFASKALFLREVPKLILQYNIHGIDIDPRATQIARLTLWLRAQREWKKQQLEVANRPSITRSNVVCAEPMPGERELLADFVDHQFPETERGLIQQLLEDIFDKMQLAGEAGSLLKIEEEIRLSIDRARTKWQKLDAKQGNLFSAAELAVLGQAGSSPNAELQSLTNIFWIDIEERVYNALRDYAEQFEDKGSFQRRLFAEDAGRGFALIAICRKRYDSILMNPPFGLPTDNIKGFLQQEYEGFWTDIYATFAKRASVFAEGVSGLIGAITSRTFLYSKQLSPLRELLFKQEMRLNTLIDLGTGVLDATVETAAWFSDCSSCYSVFHDLTKLSKQELPALAPSRLLEPGQVGPHSFARTAASFSRLPFKSFAYWIPASVLGAIKTFPSFEPNHGQVVQGMKTFDDFRYIRLPHEVENSSLASARFRYTYKGGGWSRFHTESIMCIDWLLEGAAMQAGELARYGTTARTKQSCSYWFHPGIVYSEVSMSFSAQPQAAGSLFGGSGFFIHLNDFGLRWSWLAFFNSRPVLLILSLLSTDRHWNTGMVGSLPVPEDRIDHQFLESCGRAAFEDSHKDGSKSETSLDFVKADWPSSRGKNLVNKELQKRIDLHVGEALGIPDADLDSLEQRFPIPSHRSETLPDETPDFYISYLVGIAFGRWDIRYATGEFACPACQDPFKPIAPCPLGMLKGANSMPITEQEIESASCNWRYPLQATWNGIAVDDPTSSSDLVSLIEKALYVIWGNDSSRIRDEISRCLDEQDIRAWLSTPTRFFANHLRLYSRSRRQAPIYWQLSAGSGSYSAWIYYHRFTQDTLYRLARDFVEPRTQRAEREQFELESQGTLSVDAAARLQEEQTLLHDLRVLKNELDFVAPLWNPNLNDGVIINHAILWRITPYAPWQKACKECWDKLVKGDYDWAHLAFHLWPDRVIRKCITDRSLAIAHGLEERLWQETNNGNWLPRQLSETDLQALIAEHSNPAVKNALERFLAAPPPVAPTRTRAPRSTRSSASGTTRKPRGTAAVVDAEASRQTLLALTAAPAEGLSRNAIAELLGVEAGSLTAVIKQLKEGGQIEQLGAARGARYRLTKKGRTIVEQGEP